ncbi:MAG: polysaccharide biosynthesis protein [Pirellulaceae bacterium]|nr:polysaccharide biosynthesis protein [Pirellulaceae bacterium]
MTYSLRGKNVFITGGTGTWGQEFTRQLLHMGAARIGIMSRGEYRQVEMRRAFQQFSNIDYMLGDVRDLPRMLSVTRGYQVMIHLAALKHVPVVEENAREALLTNTLGTQNVIDATMANGIERCLYVSSDKAVDPLNFYGITKLAAERMTVIANRECPDKKFITYRAGNVMGSAGSVVPIFQETLSQTNSIKLTDPAMTRFFIAKGDVVHRACVAIESAVGGEIFVPSMKAASLEMLSNIMMKRLGQGDVKVEHIGVRPGEKTHEQLISRDECKRTRALKELWVILPYFASAALQAHYADCPQVDFTEYASDTAPQFSATELEALLESESFLTPIAHHPSSPLYFKKSSFEFH